MKKLFAAAGLVAAAVIAAAAQATDSQATDSPATDSQATDSPATDSQATGGRTYRIKLLPRSPPQISPPQITHDPPPAVTDGNKPPAPAPPAPPAPPAGVEKTERARTHFRWGDAVKQSLLFLSIQHSYALTQPKTRRDLHGPFFKDYFRSVRSLHGWEDGGRFFTNYVAHPMQGSLLGFIQVQNDPAGSRLRVDDGAAYWRSRMKALAWSAAWSTQFEIGPVSQASIGNVGLHGKQTYVDIVMTPTAGLGLLVAEDLLDRYVVERIERRTNNRYARIFCRVAFNPTRTAANLLRFKKPWHRDAGLR